MTAAETFFIELIKEIPDVKQGKMFGSLCMKTPNGKSGAMLWHDNIIVKLHGNPLKEALSLSASKVFEPMPGRPMNGWIQISFDHKDHWKKFTLISVSIAALLKKK